MSNIHQLDTMTFTMRSANANIAPTNHMTPPADSTIASAWSSSALGDPATDDEDIADLAELPPDPISPAARRWPLGKNAVVAAAVVAAIGAAAVSVGLAIVTTSGSDQPKPANVVPGAAIVPAPSAPVVAPAVPVAPGAPPVVGQPDSGQPASGAASSPSDAGYSNAGGAPVLAAVPAPPDSGPPPADPGTPPASWPGGPSVAVGPDGVSVSVPNGPSVQVGPLGPPNEQGGGQGQSGAGQGQQGSGQQSGGQQSGGQKSGGQGQQGSGQQAGGQQSGGKNGPAKVCIPCTQGKNAGHL
ncbi:MAG: hypothetical protein WCC28_00550 [Mycobacterium sp.]|uniref:hypothetical protein n=1 Tax=Mycobacterium sp. TaxID=1785 RepID=UPI003C7891BA